MKKLAGSCETLFSRVALMCRALGLNSVTLSGMHYRNYIVEVYTFLKHPVLLLGDAILIGDVPEVVKALLGAAKGR